MSSSAQIAPERGQNSSPATLSPTADRRRLWLIVLSGCTAVVLLSSTSEYARLLLRGETAGFIDVVKYQAIDWYLWGLAAPLVFTLARRVRPARVGWPRAIGFHLLGGAVVAMLHILLYVLVAGAVAGILTLERFREAVPLVVPARFHVDLLAYLALLGVTYAVDYYTLSRERALRASRLETQLAHAKLDALRSQLQPHFFFNALNAVSALVRRRRNPEAVEVLAGLGDLLRDTLDSPEHEVALSREIDLLEHYVAIQRVRFGDRLSIEIDAEAATLDAAVPGLVLQPLVENAIRHGIERSEAPGRVTIRATRDGDRLRLAVSDDGPGIAPAARDGVGLANTRERLRQLYGDRHRFDVENAAGGGAMVRIELPYRRVAPDDPAETPAVTVT